MNHYLLPGTKESKRSDATVGFAARPMLVTSMINRGATLGTLTARIIGGANGQGMPVENAIGYRNSRVARELLYKMGIAVVMHDTGGKFGRKVVFDTGSGKVKVDLLNKNTTELDEEIHKGFGL